MMGLKPDLEASDVIEALSIDLSVRIRETGKLYFLADVSFSSVEAALLSAVQTVLPAAKRAGEEETELPVSVAMAIPTQGSNGGDMPTIQGKRAEGYGGETWTTEARSGGLLLCLRVYIPATWQTQLSSQTIESLKEQLSSCLQGISTWYTVR
jgi:hypothetical protein